MPPETHPQQVCPVHDESFKRLEQLIDGKFTVLETVIRSNMGNQAAENTRFAKLLDRLEQMQIEQAERLEKAFETRCQATSGGMIKTQEEHEGRIKVIERGFWKLAGGLGLLILLVNIAASVIPRLIR